MEKQNIKKVVLTIGTILLLALAVIFHDVSKAKGWVFICESVLALIILGIYQLYLGTFQCIVPVLKCFSQTW